MTQPFFIEVGCEEIPARFLASLSRQFYLNLGEELQSSGLRNHQAQLQTAYTPRRLAVWIDQILERQPDREEEIVGPPVKAACDAQGSYTPAALNFAKKFGGAAEDLYKVTTLKGEYIALRRKIAGQSAAEILSGIILRAWNRMELPRSMKWDESGFRFIRPVRWLVVLLGSEVIPVRLGVVASGRITRGHRTLGSQAIELQRADGQAYCNLLEKNFVLVRTEARRERIQAGLRQQTPEIKSQAVEDAELLEILVNLTEFPTVIRGEFNRQFLELPREVLVTVMRNHQRYFALQSGDQGTLAPGFLAVANQDQDRDGLIRQGHERVLRARFNDALFFWRHDRRRSLADRLEDLQHITFHAKLGSYHDKTQRMLRLADPLCEALNIAPLKDAVRAAMRQAKCDLNTDLVIEFTELQGQIGGRIAQAEGQDEMVWQAIYDHYLPLGGSDSIPRDLTGAAVALADKLDTLAGMFAIGEIPSGSRDPYALRRAGNGVVRILIEKQLSVSLQLLQGKALESFELNADAGRTAEAELRRFFSERQESYFQAVNDSASRDEKYPMEEIQAVLQALEVVDALHAASDPYRAWVRLQALHQIRTDQPVIFVQAAEVFKRLRNIVQQAGGIHEWLNQTPHLDDVYPEGIEKALYRQISAITLPTPETIQQKEYEDYLLKTAQCASEVEKYFNEVRVNDPNPDDRKRRLSFLAWATVQLGRVADLGRLSI